MRYKLGFTFKKRNSLYGSPDTWNTLHDKVIEQLRMILQFHLKFTVDIAVGGELTLIVDIDDKKLNRYKITTALESQLDVTSITWLYTTTNVYEVLEYKQQEVVEWYTQWIPI